MWDVLNCYWLLLSMYFRTVLHWTWMLSELWCQDQLSIIYCMSKFSKCCHLCFPAAADDSLAVPPLERGGLRLLAALPQPAQRARLQRGHRRVRCRDGEGRRRRDAQDQESHHEGGLLLRFSGILPGLEFALWGLVTYSVRKMLLSFQVTNPHNPNPRLWISHRS